MFTSSVVSKDVAQTAECTVHSGLNRFRESSVRVVGFIMIVLLCTGTGACAVFREQQWKNYQSDTYGLIAHRVSFASTQIKMNPPPPDYLYVEFYYRGGAINDVKVLHSSGIAEADQKTIEILKGIQIQAPPDAAGGNSPTRFTISFCFLPVDECKVLIDQAVTKGLLPMTPASGGAPPFVPMPERTSPRPAGPP